MDEPYLTIEDVARLMKCDRQLVEKLIKRGELPATKFAKRIRVAPADLQAYLDARRVKPNEHGNV